MVMLQLLDPHGALQFARSVVVVPVAQVTSWTCALPPKPAV